MLGGLRPRRAITKVVIRKITARAASSAMRIHPVLLMPLVEEVPVELDVATRLTETVVV
jgi:hypothetical protein